ncbi:hypothetical protein [Nocardiopsis nanhaiensis]
MHGKIEAPEHPPHEFQAARAVLSLLTGAPPPYYLGHGTDRLVLVVGGPRADSTVLTMERLLRTVAPRIQGS